MNIKEFRQEYPEYEDLPDAELAKSLHSAHYSDMDFGEFSERFGVSPKETVSDPLGYAREALQGATFEFADEVGLGVAAAAAKASEALGINPKSGKSFSDIYREMKSGYEDDREAFAEENPASSTVANLAGSVATGGAGAVKLLSKVPATASRSGKTAITAATGGAEGALYGAGAAEDGDTLDGAAKGALTGAVVAPLVSGAASRIANASAKKKARKTIGDALPRESDLAEAADAAYEKANALGIVIKPSKLAEIKTDLVSEAKDKLGFNPEIHPKVNAALKSFDNLMDEPPSLEKMEQHRRILSSVANSNDRDERRVATKLIRKFDEALESLHGDDVLTGEAKKAGHAMRTARSLWQKRAKLRTISEAVEKAELQASGFENGLRTQFRSILNSRQKRRGFSKIELDSMRAIVKGDFGGNVARFLGRFGIGRGPQSTGLGATLGAVAGDAVGGKTGAVMAPALGQAASNLSERATVGRVQALRDLVAAGKHPKKIIDEYSSGGNANPGELAEILFTAEPERIEYIKKVLSRVGGKNKELASQTLGVMVGAQAAQ